MSQTDKSIISKSSKATRFSITFLILSGVLIVYIAYPIFNVVTIVDPTTLVESMIRSQLANAFLLSMGTATVSTLILGLFGIPLAYALVRYDFRGKLLLRLLIILPLVLPPLASGALLLGVFGPYTPLGKTLSVEFTQSPIGIIIAQIYISSPFMILLAQSAFESVDESYEKVARVLGKNKLQTFLQVSLPLAKTGIMAGFIMAWVRAVGELGATMMMAYNPHTISIQIFEDNVVGGFQQTVPGILLLIVLSFIVLAIFSIVKKEGLKLGW